MPEQCRDARKLLGWSRERLGAVSGTSAHFVRYYEEFGRAIADRGGESPSSDRLRAVRVVLEGAGVVFFNGDEPGVQLREDGS
jgi:transcriptional regulator with XRE-family HTH domain